MAAQKPNILIIWGDDIGWFNVSAYNHGIMGYRTPNIDRIAKEGAMFTDWYGQQSCTAGRAAFITGQSPIRTGLTKVGLPGADLGLQPEDPERHIKHYYVAESVGIATGILLTALHLAGLATLTHTPSPMGFLSRLLERPRNERPFVLIPVGYPAADATVPKITKKPLDEVMITR